MFQIKILKLAIELKNQRKTQKKKFIARFINRKYAKKAPLNWKGLRNIHSFFNGLINLSKIFINENLTPTKSKLNVMVILKKLTQEMVCSIYSTW